MNIILFLHGVFPTAVSVVGKPNTAVGFWQTLRTAVGFWQTLRTAVGCRRFRFYLPISCSITESLAPHIVRKLIGFHYVIVERRIFFDVIFRNPDGARSNRRKCGLYVAQPVRVGFVVSGSFLPAVLFQD